jgi:hypothetical protein
MIPRSLSSGLLVLLATCGGSAAADDRLAAFGAEWRLSAAPVVSIGVADGAPEYQLLYVRGATLLSDGRIAILNGGNHSYSLYDRQGRFLRTVGGKGQGPGEFEAPVWMGRVAGDSVAVWDQKLKRLTFFGPDGTLGRVTSASGAAGAAGMFPQFVGIFPDGSAALDPGPDVMAMMRGQRGLRRDSVTLYRMAKDGTDAGTLARLAGDEAYISERQGGFAWNDRPFGSESFAALSGERLYVGDSGTGEIAVHSPDGRRVGAFRSPHPSWRVQASDVERYRERKLAPITGQERRREMEAAIREAPVPEASPTFAELLADARGNVWVQAYARPAADTIPWAVMAPDGRAVGALRVPRDLKLLEVGGDYVLGLRTDELGVERVEMYAVERGD